jgi:diadenosine tetraphosphate (Ap4A) HIT family hydrolase
MTLPTVYDDPFLTATPCIDCDVPGYLVLQPKEKHAVFAKLSVSTLQQLGPALARLEAAIQSVTGCDHVYILRFSEGLASVHFHLFPRTAALASDWKAEARPADGQLNGPSIFAWARTRYAVERPEMLSTQTLQTALAIRESIH